MLGYVVKESNMIVCGYEGRHVIVQEIAGAPTHKVPLKSNGKGSYFVFCGKRFYLKESRPS